VTSTLTPALVGLAGVGIGAVLKTSTDLLFERSRHAREDSLRFHDERRATYAAFVSAAVDLGTALRHTAQDLESLATPSRILDALGGESNPNSLQKKRDRILSEYGAVRILASDPVREAARTVFEMLLRDQATAAGVALTDFIEAARCELGVIGPGRAGVS